MATARETITIDDRLQPVAGHARKLTTLRPQLTGNAQLLADSVLLRLATVLQSSLDVRELLRLFGNELMRVVPHDRLQFIRPGEPAAEEGAQDHHCHYELKLLGKTLGNLIVSRHRPFTMNELDLLESVLCAVMYPLRNALLYEQALATALKDPVTGINNRSALNSYLGQKVSEYARHGSPVSVIMLDVDHFKTVNDRYGHPAGDAVLAAVAQSMIACTRSSDSVFRYGGEEFLVVLSNTPLAGARLLAERIRRRIADQAVSLGDGSVAVTISAGVAEIAPGQDADTLIARADQALYAAKAAGRNRVVPEVRQRS